MQRVRRAGASGGDIWKKMKGQGFGVSQERASEAATQAVKSQRPQAVSMRPIPVPFAMTM